MRQFSIFCLAVVVSFSFVSSCAVLSSGNGVKSDFDVEAQRGRPDFEPANETQPEAATEKGWAAKYIPGWSRVSNLLPPPTEARKQWDSRKSTGLQTEDDETSGWY